MAGPSASLGSTGTAPSSHSSRSDHCTRGRSQLDRFPLLQQPTVESVPESAHAPRGQAADVEQRRVAAAGLGLGVGVGDLLGRAERLPEANECPRGGVRPQGVCPAFCPYPGICPRSGVRTNSPFVGRLSHTYEGRVSNGPASQIV